MPSVTRPHLVKVPSLWGQSFEPMNPGDKLNQMASLLLNLQRPLKLLFFLLQFNDTLEPSGLRAIEALSMLLSIQLLLSLHLHSTLTHNHPHFQKILFAPNYDLCASLGFSESMEEAGLKQLATGCSELPEMEGDPPSSLILPSSLLLCPSSFLLPPSKKQKTYLHSSIKAYAPLFIRLFNRC